MYGMLFVVEALAMVGWVMHRVTLLIMIDNIKKCVTMRIFLMLNGMLGIESKHFTVTMGSTLSAMFTMFAMFSVSIMFTMGTVSTMLTMDTQSSMFCMVSVAAMLSMTTNGSVVAEAAVLRMSTM